jgi:hypothetical protein
MSGTGKSTALAELAGRGFEIADTDELDLTAWSDEDGGFVWREETRSPSFFGERAHARFTSPAASRTRDGSIRSSTRPVEEIAAELAAIAAGLGGRSSADG